MSLLSWEKYVKKINNKFKDLHYFPHPRENLEKAKKIFKNKIIFTKFNSEEYLLQNGLPNTLVGDLCSTATTTVALLNTGQCKVHGIINSAVFCDCRKGAIVEKIKIKNTTITVNFDDLIESAKSILKDSLYNIVQLSI